MARAISADLRERLVLAVSQEGISARVAAACLGVSVSSKPPAIRQAIRAAKAKLLCLPRYSPDLNPIEQLFSKLKHLPRKASG